MSMWTWSETSRGVGRDAGLLAFGALVSWHTLHLWRRAAFTTSNGAPVRARARASLLFDLCPVFSWRRLIACFTAGEMAAFSSPSPSGWPSSEEEGASTPGASRSSSSPEISSPPPSSTARASLGLGLNCRSNSSSIANTMVLASWPG